MIRPPAARPCGSCPYRQDVPSGIWALDEYVKLPDYDAETPYQPPGVFMCHQQDGRACAGWVGCHDMDENLALRIAASTGAVADPDAFRDYTTPTPLWDSGADAAAHGAKGIADPDADARRVIAKLTARQQRIGTGDGDRA